MVERARGSGGSGLVAGMRDDSFGASWDSLRCPAEMFLVFAGNGRGGRGAGCGVPHDCCGDGWIGSVVLASAEAWARREGARASGGAWGARLVSGARTRPGDGSFVRDGGTGGSNAQRDSCYASRTRLTARHCAHAVWSELTPWRH